MLPKVKGLFRKTLTAEIEQVFKHGAIFCMSNHIPDMLIISKDEEMLDSIIRSIAVV
jgi:hypothetical protein